MPDDDIFEEMAPRLPLVQTFYPFGTCQGRERPQTMHERKEEVLSTLTQESTEHCAGGDDIVNENRDLNSEK